MRGPITVTLVSTTEVDDGLGNITETSSSTIYDGVRFAPRASSERTDTNQPAVISGATLYRRDSLPVDSTDRIIIADQDPLIDGTWQVDGDAGFWGEGVEVAVKRAS